MFEALGHPIRLGILQSLLDEPLSFLELKRKVKIDSSGHLSFHLDKLRDLVTTTPEGNYKLTDEGKEALTAIKIIETFVKAKGSKPWWWKSLWIGILLITVALAVVGYLLLHTPLERVVGGAILTFLLIGGQTCRRPWRHSYEGEQCVDKAQFGQHQTLRVW
ncbi:MAG: winged helix-turn-helix domain-containing protein [Nitrososphaeria archaeon]